MSNVFKTTVLLAGLSALLLVIGQLLGGQQGMLIALVFAAGINFGSYWFSDRVVLRMYRAREVPQDHRLHRITAQLAQRANLPMPKVYVIPNPAPNAFATGRNPEHAAVAATEGILQLLDDEELAGVLAHELAHVKHRDILISSVAATIAAAIMFVTRFALFFGGGRRNRDVHPVILIGMLILAPLAAMLIQAAISRSREFGADAGGAAIVGSPRGLANALQKLEAGVRQRPMQDANPATAHMFIVKPFSGRGVVSLFSTHPPTEQRVARLLADDR